MTTMRERLIAATVQKLHAYDFGYDEAREGLGAETVDAILAELRAPDVNMIDAAEALDFPPDDYTTTERPRRSHGELFTAMIDAAQAK